LLGFFDALRQVGLEPSVGETLDATLAVREVGIERPLLREALAAALIKDHAQRATFDDVFDRYFALPAVAGRPPPPATPRPGGGRGKARAGAAAARARAAVSRARTAAPASSRAMIRSADATSARARWRDVAPWRRSRFARWSPTRSRRSTISPPS